MEQHKKGSGSDWFADSVMAEGPLDAIRKTTGATEFLGYETTEADGEVVGIIAEEQLVVKLTEIGHVKPVGVVLDRTPFYGAAGGQEGDHGRLVGEGCDFDVINTLRNGALTVHIGHLRTGRLEVGAKLTARVDENRRAGIRRAHSATHLLHYALRKTVGDQATQRGSKVEDDSLHFDFAHRGALTGDELRQVENEINHRIAEGAGVTTRLMELADARKLGAMALFGEKYPDRVRVVSMGDFSIELCGGTHLSNTGQVGLCKIISEEARGKGVRRITALTGQKALDRLRQTEDLLKQLVVLLNTPQPEDLPRRVQVLQEELRSLKQELAKQTNQSVASSIDELFANAEEVAGVKIIANAPAGASREMLRDYIDQLRGKKQPVAVLLGIVEEGKVALIAAVSRELIERGINASNCVKAAAKLVGGGGGGRPDMAEAGGRFPEKLPEALAEGAKFYREALKSDS
jgi:alanyl-tRNA synthetase